MTIGVDKGSTYTKTSEEIIIKSTVRKFSDHDINLNNESMIVELDHEKYVVGEKGNYSTDLMKAEHENTKILVYTAIANSFSEEYIKTNLVLGLPIGLYSRNKDKMKKIFKPTNDNQLTQIKVNGKKKIIVIDNIEVFPEAAGAFYTQSNKDGLVIDVGGISIDTSLFKSNKLEKYSTYSMGVMKLYSKIANELNSQYDLSLVEWDIPEILDTGLFIYGEKVDLGIHDTLSNHVEEIVERLKLEYDLKVVNNIQFTGGGSNLLFDFFKSHIPQSTLMDNVQFGNAKGFKKIGQALFKD